MSEGPSTPPPGDQPGAQPPPQEPAAGGPPPGQQPPSQPPPPQGGPPPSAPQAPQGPAVGVGQPADLTTRFLARLIDFILLGVVNFIIVVTIVMGAIFSAGTGVGFGFGFSGWGFISSLITAAIYVGYFAFMESSRGQTVGKMLLKIQTQGADGGHPTMEQAVKRNAWIALTIVPIVGWLAQIAAAIYIAVTINNNVATRQGWHDQFADGTRVIKIG